MHTARLYYFMYVVRVLVFFFFPNTNQFGTLKTGLNTT